MGCNFLPLGLLGGPLVHGFVFFCLLAVAVVKKTVDKNCRTRSEYWLDASRQFCGIGWMLVMNCWLDASLESKNTRPSLVELRLQSLFHSGHDECDFHWINTLADTTFGTLFLCGATRTIVALLECVVNSTISCLHLGNYRSPRTNAFEWSRYILQLFLWIATVSCMKIVVIPFIIAGAGPLETLAHMALAQFRSSPLIMTVVVMIATPVLMYSVQFWIIDETYRRKNATQAPQNLLRVDGGAVFNRVPLYEMLDSDSSRSLVPSSDKDKAANQKAGGHQRSGAAFSGTAVQDSTMCV